MESVPPVRQETRDLRWEGAKRVQPRVAAWRDPLWYASWAVPLLVYLLFPHRDYTADALIYAGQIESITSLFGPPDHRLNPFAISDLVTLDTLGWGPLRPLFLSHDACRLPRRKTPVSPRDRRARGTFAYVESGY
jgi:hypothetical protein